MLKLLLFLFRIIWMLLSFSLRFLPFLMKFMLWRMLRQTPYYRGFQAVELVLLFRRLVRV